MRLIDADVAIENFNRYGRPYDKWETVGIIELIKYDIPTVDAEPVRYGRWIKRGQDIFCSECDEESGYTWAGASRYSDYCPNCGCKMQGENNVLY